MNIIDTLNNLPQNEFTESLKQQYQEKQMLSMRQMEVIDKMVELQKETEALLSNPQLDWDIPFVQSLKNQFEQKGWLSKNQLAAIAKIIDQYNEVKDLLYNPDIEDIAFVQSLKKQFEDKGGLSPKQIEVLKNLD